MPSLFFIYAAICCYEYKRYWVLLIITILAALTHEVSAFIPFYILCKEIYTRGLRYNPVYLIVVVWLAIYAGLRLCIEAETEGYGFFNQIKLLNNLARKPVMLPFSILVFFVFLSRPVLHMLRQERLVYLWWFILGAIPYYIYLFFVAMTEEFRLYIHFYPMIILVFLLSQTREGQVKDKAS
jgi:hypothetical protein